MPAPITKRLEELSAYDINSMSRHELINRLNHLNPNGHYGSATVTTMRQALRSWRNIARSFEP